MYSYEPFIEYQRKKQISDAIETAKAKANTELSILIYNHFGCSGPINKKQIKKYLQLGHCDPRKGKNMNDTPTIQNMDSAKIAALMAELHADADANPGVASDGEATQPEGAFVSEDDSAHPVSVN